MRSTLAALLAALALTGAGPALAQGTTLEEDIEAIEALSALGADARDLALEDAVRGTLLNNLGLKVRVKELEASQSRLKASWAPFAPFVTGGWGYRPSRSEMFLDDYETWRRVRGDSANYNVGVGVTLPTGTSLTLSWAQGSVANELVYDPEVFFENPLGGDPIPFLTDSDFSTKWSALSIQLNQSLLEGISPVYQLRGVREAGLAIDSVEASHARDMTDAVALSLKAYWDLVAARRLVEIQRIDRRLADEQRVATQALIDSGKLAPIELLRVDEQVAAASASLLEAELAASDAEQRLRFVMGVRAGDELAATALRPVGGIAATIPQRDSEASVEMALRRNPDLAVQRLAIESERISHASARHEMLPDLDLNATLSLNGSGFDAQESVDDVFASKFPDLQLGMTFTMPVPDLGAIHNLRATDLQLQAAQLSLENVEQQVRMGIDTALRSIHSYAAQIEVARVRVDLAARSAEAAEATYASGKSTLRETFEAQADLKEARVALVQATVNELKARVDLEVLRGSLLETLGVEVQ